MAAINELDVVMADVGNAYLNAKTREKVYAIAGPKFGKDEEAQSLSSGPYMDSKPLVQLGGSSHFAEKECRSY